VQLAAYNLLLKEFREKDSIPYDSIEEIPGLLAAASPPFEDRTAALAPPLLRSPKLLKKTLIAGSESPRP
jgi:hypothetical protein